MVSHSLLKPEPKLKDAFSQSKQTEFEEYACHFWGAHLQLIINLPSSRTVVALSQVDTHGLLSTALQGKQIRLGLFLSSLQRCIGYFQIVVQWAQVC